MDSRDVGSTRDCWCLGVLLVGDFALRDCGSGQVRICTRFECARADSGVHSSVSSKIQEQLLRRIVKRFRGGLVFKAQRILYHSTLGSRVTKKKKKSPAH